MEKLHSVVYMFSIPNYICTALTGSAFVAKKLIFNKEMVMTGVFVCMYTMVLALGDPLIEPCSVPGFNKGMTIELHEQKPNSVPATGPEPV